jgi:hypothetical protein
MRLLFEHLNQRQSGILGWSKAVSEMLNR